MRSAMSVDSKELSRAVVLYLGLVGFAVAVIYAAITERNQYWVGLRVQSRVIQLEEQLSANHEQAKARINMYYASLRDKYPDNWQFITGDDEPADQLLDLKQFTAILLQKNEGLDFVIPTLVGSLSVMIGSYLGIPRDRLPPFTLGVCDVFCNPSVVRLVGLIVFLASGIGAALFWIGHGGLPSLYVGTVGKAVIGVVAAVATTETMALLAYANTNSQCVEYVTVDDNTQEELLRQRIIALEHEIRLLRRFD